MCGEQTLDEPHLTHTKSSWMPHLFNGVLPANRIPKPAYGTRGIFISASPPIPCVDIFGSRVFLSIHWERTVKIPTCCSVTARGSSEPKNQEWWMDLSRPQQRTERELAQVQCDWKKSQILISSLLLTLITFSTCSQEWSFDREPWIHTAQHCHLPAATTPQWHRNIHAFSWAFLHWRARKIFEGVLHSSNPFAINLLKLLHLILLDLW